LSQIKNIARRGTRAFCPGLLEEGDFKGSSSRGAASFAVPLKLYLTGGRKEKEKNNPRGVVIPSQKKGGAGRFIRSGSDFEVKVQKQQVSRDKSTALVAVDLKTKRRKLGGAAAVKM